MSESSKLSNSETESATNESDSDCRQNSNGIAIGRKVSVRSLQSNSSNSVIEYESFESKTEAPFIRNTLLLNYTGRTSQSM